jgi:hypothetical protein
MRKGWLMTATHTIQANRYDLVTSHTPLLGDVVYAFSLSSRAGVASG